VDLLLNATSLGLKLEDGSPLTKNIFAETSPRVYDMIYNGGTKLLVAPNHRCEERQMESHCCNQAEAFEI